MKIADWLVSIRSCAITRECMKHVQPFASSQIVLYHEKRTACKENQHKQELKFRQMYLSIIQEATFNFLSSPTGLALSGNFGTKRNAPFN